MAAQALAVNGARVYIVGRTESKLRVAADVHGRNIKGEIIPLVGDVTNKDDIKCVQILSITIDFSATSRESRMSMSRSSKSPTAI